MPSSHRIMSGGIIVLLVITLIGCQSQEKQDEQASVKQKQQAAPQIKLDNEIDPAALQGDLSNYYDRVLSGMIGVSSDIAATTTSRQVREETLRQKIRTARVLRMISSEPDPRQQYLAAWIITAQARYYLTEGDGQHRFGDQQYKVVNLINDLEKQILDIGRKHFTEEQIDMATDDVEKLARRQALTALIFQDIHHSSPVIKKKQTGDLEAIIGIPMSPVAGLQGIGDTPAAINNVAGVTNRFATIVSDMPEITRWQLELFFFEVETSATITSLMNYLDKYEQDFNTISQTVERLPQEIREQLNATTEDINRMQPELQQTLADTRLALEQTNTVVKSIDTTSQSLTVTADRINSAAGTIAGIITDVRTMKGPPDPDKKPFDIQPYVELSQNLDRSTGELRSLLADLNKSVAPTGEIGQLSEHFKVLLNAMLWRGIVLIVVFFGVAYGYRRLVKRIPG